MKNKNINYFVHQYLKANIKQEEITIDATVGNGYDTLLLTNLSKFVYGFDIQEKAINETNKKLLANNKTNYQLILDSHLNILNYVKNFKGVVFNLGYLPGSNKEIVTKTETTIATLTALTKVMKKDTFIIITCYPGHQEGQVEAKAVNKFSKNLNNSFRVYKYEIINITNLNPPFVIIIEKKD